MIRLLRFLVLTALILLLVAPAASHVKSAELSAAGQPNILIILADDLGYGDTGCYNPQRCKIETPGIDRLASQGMRFTDAHSTSAVCSPSRYSLLTGRYHWRTWLQSGIVNKFGPPMIAPDRQTIADLLRERGYRAACFGKWHLGWNWPIPANRRDEFLHDPRDTSNPPDDAKRALWREVFSQPITGGPLDAGFDQFFGVDLPNFPPFCYIEGNRTVGIPTDVLSAELMKNNLADFSRPAIAGWQLKPVLPELADKASEIIQASASTPEPFFLYLPLTAPHTPLAVNEDWQDKSGLNAYADFVMETDATIDRILSTLESAKLADNTLVIFSSDNGCAPYVGIEELANKGHFPSWPYRGFKTDIWEGAHRVPFIVRWPRVVKAGTTCDALVQQVDTMATIAELLDIKLAPNMGEDSFSYLPLLTGDPSYERGFAVIQSIKGMFAIRQGQWKLVLGPGSGGWDPDSDGKSQQLYDVQSDPQERHNLVDQHPELVTKLTNLMKQVVEDGRTRPGATPKNDVAVAWQQFRGEETPQ